MSLGLDSQRCVCNRPAMPKAFGSDGWFVVCGERTLPCDASKPASRQI